MTINNKTDEYFRRQVLAELERRGWAVNKLATTMDKLPVKQRVARDVVHKWLAGRNRITDKNLARIYDVLGITIASSKDRP